MYYTGFIVKNLESLFFLIRRPNFRSVTVARKFGRFVRVPEYPIIPGIVFDIMWRVYYRTTLRLVFPLSKRCWDTPIYQPPKSTSNPSGKE